MAAAGAVAALAVTGAGIYKANQLTNAGVDGASKLGDGLASGLDKLETRIEDLPFGDIGGGVFASAKTGVTIFVAIGAVVAAYQIYKLVDSRVVDVRNYNCAQSNAYHNRQSRRIRNRYFLHIVSRSVFLCLWLFQFHAAGSWHLCVWIC